MTKSNFQWGGQRPRSGRPARFQESSDNWTMEGCLAATKITQRGRSSADGLPGMRRIRTCISYRPAKYTPPAAPSMTLCDRRALYQPAGVVHVLGTNC